MSMTYICWTNLPEDESEVEVRVEYSITPCGLDDGYHKAVLEVTLERVFVNGLLMGEHMPEEHLRKLRKDCFTSFINKT